MKTFSLSLLFSVITLLSSAQTSEELMAKATAAIELRDYKSALKYLDNALKLDPENADLHVSRGKTLFELDRYDEALQELTRAIELEPHASKFYNYRAHFFGKLDITDRMMKDYDAALGYAENDSVRAYILCNRAAWKMLDREFESAYADLMQSYAVDSTDINVLNNLAMACESMGNYDQALKYMLRVLETYPDFSIGYSNIGFVYQKMENHQKAIEYFDKSIEQDSENAYSYNNRAYSKLKLGDLKGAMADVGTSLKLLPSNAYAYRTRALIWIAMDKTKKACEDLQTAIDKGFLEQFGPEAAELQSKYCR
jgi:tetratricopeptide (TPR) repeat protein